MVVEYVGMAGVAAQDAADNAFAAGAVLPAGMNAVRWLRLSYNSSASSAGEIDVAEHGEIFADGSPFAEEATDVLGAWGSLELDHVMNTAKIHGDTL